MKDLGLMHYFLGLEVEQKSGEIFLSPGKYIVKLLERCGMVHCKSMSTPMELNFKKLCGSVAGPELENSSEYRQLMGALMFLVNSHPNICFTVNTLSQFMVEPHHIHWIVDKNLLKYLYGTIIYGIRHTVRNLRLHGHFDADWAANPMSDLAPPWQILRSPYAITVWVSVLPSEDYVTPSAGSIYWTKTVVQPSQVRTLLLQSKSRTSYECSALPLQETLLACVSPSWAA
eukprot:PITA_23485